MPYYSSFHPYPLSQYFGKSLKWQVKSSYFVGQSLQPTIMENQPSNPSMMKYFKACVEVCWLAVIQDPPLAIDISPGETFNAHVFHEHNTCGPYVEYVVSHACYSRFSNTALYHMFKGFVTILSLRKGRLLDQKQGKL